MHKITKPKWDACTIRHNVHVNKRRESFTAKSKNARKGTRKEFTGTCAIIRKP